MRGSLPTGAASLVTSRSSCHDSNAVGGAGTGGGPKAETIAIRSARFAARAAISAGYVGFTPMLLSVGQRAGKADGVEPCRLSFPVRDNLVVPSHSQVIGPKLQLDTHSMASMRTTPSVQNSSDSASCGSTEAGMASAVTPNDSGSHSSSSRNSASAAACRRMVLDVISSHLLSG